MIQYYQNASPPLEFTGIPPFPLHGITSRVIVKKKRGYGSKYSRIYCYCIVHSSSYCLFTYYLCKNSQPK
uniref:Photosystem II protein M n=1 Tax=Sporobolus helvolus TaxID=1629762 RepID=A0A4D6FXS2_9POAL|nr:photosystem II protein M [Sporobolus helvolus]QCB91566.1 photosystem II protein M [Sporobolus helvolus]